jgi:hypothetical protein
MSEKCGELVVRCFQARTEAHLAHLATSSYAEHKALNDFYDEIIDLTDSYAECAQGRCGKLKYAALRPKVGDLSRPVSIPVDLRDWIDENRKQCGDASELQNLIDEIVALCDQTIYKLRFLS